MNCCVKLLTFSLKKYSALQLLIGLPSYLIYGMSNFKFSIDGKSVAAHHEVNLELN